MALAFLTLPADGETAFDAHGGAVRGLAIDPAGRRVLTASFDYSVVLWRLSGKMVEERLFAHEAPVNDVTFLPDEDHALSVGDDGALLLWDLGHPHAPELNRKLGTKVAAVAVGPAGGLAATAGWDRKVRLWDLPALEPVGALEVQANPTCVAFSGSGAWLATGDADGTLHLWRVADKMQVFKAKRHDFAITALALAGDLAATASVDETVRLWDLNEGEVQATLYGHEGPVLAVALSPEGDLVASGGVDGTVRVWREGDGDELQVYDRHAGPVWSVAFTPDGRTVVSGGADGLLVTHDLDRRPGAEIGEPHTGGLDLAALDGLDDGSRGAEAFRKCAACHTVTPDGGHRAGPTLYDVFGRTAGTVPGYPYSKALRNSDLVWTRESIDRLFQVGPEAFVPGSKMPLQQMPDPRDREALLGFLERVTRPSNNSR